MNVYTIGVAEILDINGARIFRVGFFCKEMPIGIAKPS